MIWYTIYIYIYRVVVFSYWFLETTAYGYAGLHLVFPLLSPSLCLSNQNTKTSKTHTHTHKHTPDKTKHLNSSISLRDFLLVCFSSANFDVFGRFGLPVHLGLSDLWWSHLSPSREALQGKQICVVFALAGAGADHMNPFAQTITEKIFTLLTSN